MNKNLKIALGGLGLLAVGYVILRQSKLAYIKKTLGGEEAFNRIFGDSLGYCYDKSGRSGAVRRGQIMPYFSNNIKVWNKEDSLGKYILGGIAYRKNEGKLVLFPIERYIFNYAKGLKRGLKTNQWTAKNPTTGIEQGIDYDYQIAKSKECA